MPVFDDKDDQRFYNEEQNNGNGSGSGGGGDKKGGRKRASTTFGGRKESKRTPNKVCRVCGDKAFSYNFNVITCESCKAFFRRNANKEKEMRCAFNEQCEINQVSRRFCQKCRLTKCFSVGMKKEWILSEEARIEMKQRLDENRERRMMEAMKCAIDEASMEDDSENSYDDEEPKGSQISVRKYLSSGENSVLHQNRQMEQYNGMEDNNEIVKNEPSDIGYSNQNYDYPISSSYSTEPMDQSDYCDASTIVASDPSSSNNVALNARTAVETKPLPIEPNPLPPSVLFSASMSAVQEVAAIMSSEANNLGMCPHDMVSDNLRNEAIVTQQLAAAVVAQQVVSHIGPVIPTVPLMSPPQMGVPINPGPRGIPIIPKELPVNEKLLNELEKTNANMVTVHKDVLMKLLQNSRTSCTCTCQCGKYPPGSRIVDEVTKDLINSGGGSSCH